MYAHKECLESIVKILIKCNFTNSQIRIFLSNHKRDLSSLDKLQENYEYYHENMITLGYNEYQIHELACKYPKAISFRFSLKKLKQEYADYLSTIPDEEENKIEHNHFEFNKIIKLLTDLGVSEKRIDFIFSKNVDTIFKEPKEVEDNIEFYYSLGLTKENLVSLLNHHATILDYGEEDYKESLDKMSLLGFCRHDLGRIILNLAKARRAFYNDDLVNFIDWAVTKPLDYEKVGNRLLKTSSLITLSKESLDNGYKNVMDLGFSELGAGHILSDALSVITMSYENLLYKLSIPTYVGASIKDARLIVYRFPGFLTQSPDSLMSKFKVYSRRGLLNFIIRHPKNVIQNAEITDGRALYLSIYHPEISEPAYSRMVFTSESTFKKRFGVSGEFTKSLLMRKNKKEGEYIMSKKSIEELTTFLLSSGFNESEIRKLTFSYNRYKDNYNSIDELKQSYTNYYDNMIRLGYSEYELHELASIHPKAMFQKFKNGELEEYYIKYLAQTKKPKSELSIEEKIEVNRRILLALGIPASKVSGILKTNIPLIEMHPEDLKSNISFYLSCGITDEELKSIINSNSTVLLFGKNEYDILFKDFDFFSKDDLGKMVLFYSKNNTIVQPDCLYKTLKFAEIKKLDIIKLKKWLRKNIIKNVDEDDLESSYEGLIKLGFTEEQAILAASESLSILYKPTLRIEYIIEVARRYAVSKEDIIRIITGFPAFADLKEESIREKIAVMTRYNLTSYVVLYPKSLIQGAELIDARAYYLRMFHPKVTGTEFASDIFVQESAFEKKYNRPNDYLKDLRKLLKR